MPGSVFEIKELNHVYVTLMLQLGKHLDIRNKTIRKFSEISDESGNLDNIY